MKEKDVTINPQINKEEPEQQIVTADKLKELKVEEGEILPKIISQQEKKQKIKVVEDLTEPLGLDQLFKDEEQAETIK